VHTRMHEFRVLQWTLEVHLWGEIIKLKINGTSVHEGGQYFRLFSGYSIRTLSKRHDKAHIGLL